MANICNYKCVNCGEAAPALYKIYSTSVLKLTKCESCKGIVDKYIEYDPVIVMIDLVLMSKEAQRHVLYNTEFKSFWKLLIVLMMLETYGVWRNDSLFNIVINTFCGFGDVDITHINILGPQSWRDNCWAWEQIQKEDDSDLFIWEKDFYIQFISIFSGVLSFLTTVQVLMKLVPHCRTEVSRLVKAYSLAHVSVTLTLPMLVWGGEAPARSAVAHYGLVFAYSQLVFLNVLTVLYECPVYASISILTISNITKYLTSYHVTPLMRTIIS